MVHAINAAWGRLARPIRVRLHRPFEYATWHGWQARCVRFGVWEFRDPRFGQLAAIRSASAPQAHTWAQAAIADRIRVLDDQYCPYDGSVLLERTDSGGTVIYCGCGWETTTRRRRS